MITTVQDSPQPPAAQPLPAVPLVVVAPAQAEPGLATRVRQMLVLGGSFVGGGSIVVSFVELLRSEPDKGFGLLRAWGGWVFVVLAVIFALNGWVVKLLAILDRTGSGLVQATRELGVAVSDNVGEVRKIAVAQQQSADKSDRDMQEVQTTVAYTVQESERTAQAVRAVAETTSDNHVQLMEIKQMIAAAAATPDFNKMATAVRCHRICSRGRSCGDDDRDDGNDLCDQSWLRWHHGRFIWWWLQWWGLRRWWLRRWSKFIARWRRN